MSITLAFRQKIQSEEFSKRATTTNLTKCSQENVCNGAQFFKVKKLDLDLQLQQEMDFITSDIFVNFKEFRKFHNKTSLKRCFCSTDSNDFQNLLGILSTKILLFPKLLQFLSPMLPHWTTVMHKEMFYLLLLLFLCLAST